MKILFCAMLYSLMAISSAVAQRTFDGAPDPQRGVFLKALDPLDDVRGFCVDLPGHLQGVDLSADVVVHTCKDGFWNYDERFDETAFASEGVLRMPAFNKCLASDDVVSGARLHLRTCAPGDKHQSWTHHQGRLQLTSTPNLCLTIAAAPSEVSRGTRNHPVRHLVRPLTLETCVPEAASRQLWAFTPPSEVPGIRYPDGLIR